jgi:hypothetical protein
MITTADSDLGFGTEYEKEIFTEILSRISKTYGLNSFLNYPKNDLLGSTESLTKPFIQKGNQPDLLWNFCEFENAIELTAFFKTVEHFSPRFVLIVTQNYRNPGTLLHFLYHKLFGKEWDHGYLSKMTVRPIESFSKVSGKYDVLEIGLFDAPWFILDVYETGKYLKKLVPQSKQFVNQKKKSFFEASPRIIKKWASHHNYILLKRSV